MPVNLNKPIKVPRVPKRPTVMRDYVIDGVTVTDVPFHVSTYNRQEPYLLDGDTLEQVYRLLDENNARRHKRMIIPYNMKKV